MASVSSQFIEEVTAHGQSDSLEDAREMCADGTYFPSNLRTLPSPCFVKRKGVSNMKSEIPLFATVKMLILDLPVIIFLGVNLH